MFLYHGEVRGLPTGMVMLCLEGISGQSGSPVWSCDAAGNAVLLGVHARSGLGPGPAGTPLSTFSFAVEMTARVTAQVQRWMNGAAPYCERI